MTTTTTARDRFAAGLPTRHPADLLNLLQSATLQNHYGSHDDDIHLLRTELLNRMGATK